jgi:methylmalonyl-CoA carboxyltransferase small subunit
MKLKVKVNGVDFDVEVEQVDDGRQHAAPPLYTPPAVPVITAPAASNTAPAVSAEGIVSPVSGTVLEVKCKPGDRVKPGDPIVTIDSMKMETTVPSDREGVISRIAVQKGDSVREGQLLAAF